MPQAPPDEELLTQLDQLRLEQPSLGLGKLVQQLRDNNPEWALSVQHVRKVSKRRQLNNEIAEASENKLHTNGPSLATNEPTQESPMSALMQVLGRFLAGGDRQAAKRAAQVDMTFKQAFDVTDLVNNPELFAKTDLTSLGINYPMRSCKLAVTIILQIVAPDKLLHGCIAWSSRSLGGLPTAAQIHTQRSASLPLAFARAKEAALRQNQSTALAVNIIDVEMTERGEGIKYGSLNYMSFAHAFVIFVGPEGARVLQAWGEHGYSLGQNLESPASRLRDWSEAQVFVDQYDRLANMQPTWKPKTYEVYKECFGINIPKITGRSGPESKSVTPYFRPWTRIKEINDVNVDDIKRWLKVIDVIDGLIRS